MTGRITDEHREQGWVMGGGQYRAENRLAQPGKRWRRDTRRTGHHDQDDIAAQK